MPPALREALVAAAALAARHARDPWWVIGSAAVLLHGLSPGPVEDVDLLTSAADAYRLLAGIGATVDDTSPRSQFRSVFGGWAVGGVHVEIMGGLEVYAEARWHPVSHMTRERRQIDGATLFVPARAELAAIMRRFGRPKDLARAALLEAAV